MTTVVIDQLYFEWLCRHVQGPDPDRVYNVICDRMHQIVFNDSVPHDDNRTAEGIALREQFAEGRPYLPAAVTDNTQATMLEVIIGLCFRADYMAERGLAAWFEQLLMNLGLVNLYDSRCYPRDIFIITNRLNQANDRKYSRSGEGGLFPLNYPRGNQRRTELWYQMSAFIVENHMI